MIELSIQPRRFEVRAGGQGRTILTIHNQASEARAYKLEAHGIPAGWSTLSPAQATIPANAVAQAALTIHPPADAVPSVVPFFLVATGVEDPADVTRVEGVLLVEAAATPVIVPPPPARGRSLWLPVGIAALLAAAAAIVVAVVALHGRHHTAAPPCRGSLIHGACKHATAVPPRPTTTARPSATPRPTLRPTISPRPSTAVPTVLALRPGLPLSPKRPPGLFRFRHRAAGVRRPSATITPTTVVSGTATLTATPIPPTASPTASVTLTPSTTASATATSTFSPSPTPTLDPTQTPTNTATRTATPSWTTSPTPSHTPTITPTIAPTGTPTQTPTTIPTPGELGLHYSYDLAPNRFTLVWHTTNVGSFQIDGLSQPLNGQRVYALRTHTFVLEGTSVDGSQTKIAVVALTVLGPCRVQVNDAVVATPDSACPAATTASSTATPARAGPLLPSPTAAPGTHR